MSQERLDYFPDWPDAERVLLSGVVDAVFEPLIRNDRGILSRIEFPYDNLGDIHRHVPDRYLPVFMDVLNELIVQLVDHGYRQVIADVETRYRGTPITHRLIERVKRELNDTILDRIVPGRRHVTTLADLLRGCLEIDPYRLDVPITIRMRIVSHLTLKRLGISSIPK